jgi:hypothetical protein
MDQKQYRRYLYSLAVLFVTAIALFVISIVWSNRAADSAREDANRSVKETQQVMCLAFNLIHEGQQREPPTTEAGKSFAKVVKDIRERFDC